MLSTRLADRAPSYPEAPAFAFPSGRGRIGQASWASRKVPVTLANGLRLAYVELGDPRGEPLLLLHGFTDSSRSWSLSAPYLSRYRLLIPDQRGHGAADAPLDGYSVAQLARDAALFLDALGIRKAAVVGHSLGSMVAIDLAADHPERVSRIVLVGSTALVPVRPGDWLYDNVDALSDPLDPSSQFLTDWHPSNQPTPIDPDFAAAVEQDYLAMPVPVWKSVMRELANIPVGRQAARVNAPTLVLSGGEDPLFPSEHHEALLAAIPHAEAHVFPGLGHNPNWEQPEAIAAHIARFLEAN